MEKFKILLSVLAIMLFPGEVEKNENIEISEENLDNQYAVYTSVENEENSIDEFDTIDEVFQKYDVASVETIVGTDLADFKYGYNQNGGITITGYKFSGLEGRNHVEIPETYNDCNINAIGDEAFWNKDILSVKMGDKVEYIGVECFYSCRSLSSVYLSKNLIYLSDRAFANCFSLKSIEIPAGVETLEEYAFFQCPALGEIIFNDGLKTIGYRAFRSCTGLPTTKLPRTLKTIEEEGFCRCQSLKSIKIPRSVESIGKKAFGDCTSLEKIVIFDNIKNLTVDIFEGSPKVTIYCEKYSPAYEFAILNSIPYVVLEDVTLSYDSNTRFEVENMPKNQILLQEDDGYISESIPTRENHEFLGWTSIEGSKEIEFAPGDEICITENTTLYAIWDGEEEEEEFFEDLTKVTDENGDIYLEGIEKGTTVEQIISKVKNREVEVIDKNGEKVEITEKLATGMQIKISVNEKNVTYKVVILGDINGDGEISDIDLLMLARYMISCERELELVKDEYLRATNMFYDDELAGDRDLLKLARELLN